MQALKKIPILMTRLITKTPFFSYGSDTWKERDEAAEKVYITEAEKTTIKKLLKKVEQEKDDQLHDNKDFEGSLREILKRHEVTNEAFFSQVSNLHKILSHY